MDSKAPRLDKAFIARKHEQLTKLREQLLKATQSGTDDEENINSESAGHAREYEDDAQRLANLELDGTLVGRDVQRLALVERALRKIEDGTYGYSDESGASIPVERLEAIPEAIYTLAEQKTRDPSDASAVAPSRRT